MTSLWTDISGPLFLTERVRGERVLRDRLQEYWCRNDSNAPGPQAFAGRAMSEQLAQYDANNYFDVTGCDDKTSFICGAGLCRSGLPGLSAGCQGFRPHDGNREHELRSLAVHARASIRGNRLDLRFLDGTQLRCCSKWSNTSENRRGGDSGRSRKNMRSANVADISQRPLILGLRGSYALRP